MDKPNTPQAERFREAARFDAHLKKVAKAPKPKDTSRAEPE